MGVNDVKLYFLRQNEAWTEDPPVQLLVVVISFFELGLDCEKLYQLGQVDVLGEQYSSHRGLHCTAIVENFAQYESLSLYQPFKATLRYLAGMWVNKP